MRAARYIPQMGMAWKALAMSATSRKSGLPFLRASAATATTAAPVLAGALSGEKPVWILSNAPLSCQMAEVGSDMLSEASFKNTSMRQICLAPSSVAPRGPLLVMG